MRRRGVKRNRNRSRRFGTARRGAVAQRNTSVMHENEIGTIVIESPIAIHRELGPGLLETVYEVELAHELKARGPEVQRQVPIPIKYNSISFDELNFPTALMKDGIVRAVSGLHDQ